MELLCRKKRKVWRCQRDDQK